MSLPTQQSDSRFNLTKVQHQLVKLCKTDHWYHDVCYSDKNLGLTGHHGKIRAYLMCSQRELNKNGDYENLAEQEATKRLTDLRATLDNLIKWNQPSLSTAEHFRRSLEATLRIPVFYLTILEVHKSPWGSRPVPGKLLWQPTEHFLHLAGLPNEASRSFVQVQPKVAIKTDIKDYPVFDGRLEN